MLLKSLLEVRRRSEALIQPLEPEDLGLQGMADASPPKWHLAHTTWFFETFLLQPHLAGHQPCDSRWSYQFNSYYEAVGDRHPRPERGLLSRPGINEILEWRHRVDTGLSHLLEAPSDALRGLAELGLHHEQQHQELLLMDLLDGFSRQPLEPCYSSEADLKCSVQTAEWLACDEGLVEVGHSGNGFHFDNESPRHRVWLDRFELCSDLVSNGDYLAFIADGGYQRPELWMSEGWSRCREEGWQAPRYWRHDNEEFTLAGRQPLDPEAPVRHVSWFEADAFARWSGARLPSEAEWEHARVMAGDALHHAHGVLWQWTSSPYRPYPGFTLPAGAIGEYNGKFMSSQFVLRGSCWLTPPGHGRDSYRNFFPPASRWMASGIRLAR
ncbi:MAG: ergothioneine biosynthesis protein EgtB [Synechococcus sp.]|nr:ergothioneine biosynthesis protein EgtB [Synechococcus sp.]